MGDVIGIDGTGRESAQVASLETLVDAANRITEGDLQGVEGVLVAWITSEGLIGYTYSQNIDLSSAGWAAECVALDCKLHYLPGDE